MAEPRRSAAGRSTSPAAIGMMTRLARYRQSRSQYIEAPRGDRARPACPVRRRTSPGRRVPARTPVARSSTARGGPASTHDRAEARRSWRSATRRLGRLSASRVPMSPGKAVAAPNGVIASALTAWVSCVGHDTVPLEGREEDSHRNHDHEDRQGEEAGELAGAALVQEQRGQRHAHPRQQHAGGDHEQHRRPTAAIGAAPVPDPHDGGADGERRHGRDRDAHRADQRQHAGQAGRPRPSTAKRRGSNGSVAPRDQRREREAERHRRAAEHGDRDHHLGLRRRRA